MRKDQETMTAILDALLSNPSLRRAAKRAGVSEATVFRWLRASSENPEEWIIEWSDHGPAPWHEHIKLAQKIYRALALGDFEETATRGTREKLWFGGKPVWIEREDIIAEGYNAESDPEILFMLFGQRDIYLRNPVTGERVQATIAKKPNDALALAFMRANFPQYGDHRSLDVRVGGGVSIIGAPQAAAPRAVENRPPPVQVEHHPVADLDYDPVTGIRKSSAEPSGAPPSREPGAFVGDPEEQIGAAPSLDDRPATMVASAEDVDPQEGVTGSKEAADGSELSPLKRDLLQRLRTGVRNPHPNGPVAVGKPEDERVKG